MRRWRMVLGGTDDPDADGTGVSLQGTDVRVDAALAAIYDTRSPRPNRRSGRAGGLSKSAPSVARWLGDIRRYFPTQTVQVLQRDAIDRLGLQRLLLEPEMLQAIEPDLHLVTLLMELNKLLPDTTRATARQVVAGVVEQLRRRLAAPTQQAVHGALAACPARSTPSPRRHRLAAHHPGQPAPLPARAAHGGARAARRLRPPAAQPGS